jgi:hypothetical protein
MKQEMEESTPQQQKEWFDQRISLCNEAHEQLQAYNKWVSDLDERVQSTSTSISTSIGERKLFV